MESFEVSPIRPTAVGVRLMLTLVGTDKWGDPGNKQHFIWAGVWTRLG